MNRILEALPPQTAGDATADAAAKAVAVASATADANATDVKSCCANLYENDVERMLLGGSFHPGGLALTERLGQLLNLQPGQRVLDVATGQGTSTIFLAQHFGCEVVGVDYVRRAIRTAKSKAKQAGLDINFLVDDVTRLEKVNGPFDLILDIGCLHGLSSADKLAYARNLGRLLAPKGKYLLYAWLGTPNGGWSGLDESD